MPKKPTGRKKYSRVRTGCLTCRQRRVKCDEKKPICGRCDKGSRECAFPPPKAAQTGSKDVIEASAIEINSPGSSTSPSFDDEDERERTLVKFTPALTSESSSSDNTDPFSILQLDEQMVIDSLAPPSSPVEPLFTPPVELVFSPISGLSPVQYSHSLQIGSPSEPVSTSILHLPRMSSPQSSRSQAVQFFLSYHRHSITEAHYFRWHDLPEFCTKLIFSMAEESSALQHSLVAFSALIYSIKVHHGVRALAFVYYAKALQELRLLLNETSMTLPDCYVAVTIALQLSSFDRFFGDAGKCFRHLEGASQIMLSLTDPVQFCSTVIGRSLLGWYMQFEDYCCFLGAFKFLLPDAWREEDVRIRQILAEVEYPRLSPEARIPRLLDDIWAQFLALIPKVSNVLCKIPVLKTMESHERIIKALQLNVQLQEFVNEAQAFLNLPLVIEALQPASSTPPYGWRHVNCCPPLPFVPHAMKYPRAGMFRIMIYAFKCYIHAIIYPAIQVVLGSQAKLTGMEPAELCSIESCKTFAGLEDSYLGENPDNFLPLFASIGLAAAPCPPDLRIWLWSKFVHFEKLGHLTFDPMRSRLANLWDMPEIMTEQSLPEKESSPDFLRTLSCDDIEATMKEINLEDEAHLGESEVMDDGSLEPITRARGLYGL